MNRIRSVLFVLFLVICGAFGSGCSKPAIGLVVASQLNVNPDHSGRPSPVIVKMYELRNDLAFKQADFNSLFDMPIQVLGADLVAADEIVFIPGEARRILYHPNENTRFVGIVAGFRQLDRALWRIIKPVDPEKTTWLAIELNDASILVMPEDSAESWDAEKAVRHFQQRVNTDPAKNGAGAAAPSPQSGAMTPEKQPASTSTPAKGPLTSARDRAATKTGTQTKQSTKEIITIINQDGVETLRGATQEPVGASSPVQPGAEDSVPFSLPPMRSY